jgi:hypothetical protein
MALLFIGPGWLVRIEFKAMLEVTLIEDLGSGIANPL